MTPVHTFEFWLEQVTLFKRAFADPTSGEDILTNCVRGIALLASDTIKANPGCRSVVMAEYEVCIQQAVDRQGLLWLIQKAAIIADHAPCPRSSTGRALDS